MPVTQGNITRCDIRVPNELYAEIEKIAVEQFNASTHWKSGKTEVTSTILELIRYGIRYLSDDMDSGSKSAQITGNNYQELSDRLAQVEEQILSDNLSDNLSDDRLTELADRLAAVETRLASDDISDKISDKISDISDNLSKALADVRSSIGNEIEQKLIQVILRIEGIEVELEHRKEALLKADDIASLGEPNNELTPNSKELPSPTQVDKATLAPIFDEVAVIEDEDLAECENSSNVLPDRQNERGYTDEELASLIDVASTTLYRIRTGKTKKPSPSVAGRLLLYEVRGDRWYKT
jgi:hypothetical protein